MVTSVRLHIVTTSRKSILTSFATLSTSLNCWLTTKIGPWLNTGRCSSCDRFYPKPKPVKAVPVRAPLFYFMAEVCRGLVPLARVLHACREGLLVWDVNSGSKRISLLLKDSQLK